MKTPAANPAASSPIRRLIERRTFVAGCAASAATAAAARAAARPCGGLFVSGPAVVRVGVIGCGGRGTGAAIQAAAADPAVAITALGDLFADQVASSADLLATRAGRRFDCPPERRFVGPDAWQHVLASDVDLVILAAPPHTRPLHLSAAVAAGRHVFCETPAAIDLPGAQVVRMAAAEADRRGLSLVSGLQWRHHEPTREAIARLHEGDLGRILQVQARSFIGLPWHKPRQAGWSSPEMRLRNWISCPDLSGGHLVERHVHAIDKALWVLGADLPIRAVPLDPAAGAARSDVCRPTWAARFDYADGRSIEAVIDRRPRSRSQVEEWVRGTRGTRTLPPLVGNFRDSSGRDGDPCQTAMSGLVTALLAGTRADDSEPLWRSSLVAALGRAAIDSRGTVSLADVPPAALASRQAVQSIPS